MGNLKHSVVRIVRLTKGLGASGLGLVVTTSLLLVKVLGVELLAMQLEADMISWAFWVSLAFTLGALLGRFESPVSEKFREKWASSVSARIGSRSKHTVATDLIEISFDIEIETKRRLKGVTSVDIEFSFGNSVPHWIDNVSYPYQTFNRGEKLRIPIFGISFPRTSSVADLEFRNGERIIGTNLEFSFILIVIKVHHGGGTDFIKFIYFRRHHPSGRCYAITRNIDAPIGNSMVDDQSWEYEFGPRDKFLTDT